jgi:hypothetical protein
MRLNHDCGLSQVCVDRALPSSITATGIEMSQRPTTSVSTQAQADEFRDSRRPLVGWVADHRIAQPVRPRPGMPARPGATSVRPTAASLSSMVENCSSADACRREDRGDVDVHEAFADLLAAHAKHVAAQRTDRAAVKSGTGDRHLGDRSIGALRRPPHVVKDVAGLSIWANLALDGGSESGLPGGRLIAALVASSVQAGLWSPKSASANQSIVQLTSERWFLTPES